MTSGEYLSFLELSGKRGHNIKKLADKDHFFVVPMPEGDFTTWFQ